MVSLISKIYGKRGRFPKATPKYPESMVKRYPGAYHSNNDLGLRRTQEIAELKRKLDKEKKRTESRERNAQYWQQRTQRAEAQLKRKPHPFYDSEQWRVLRYKALARSKGCCELCGAAGKLHVDHIKPRSKYPDLSLRLDNLQVLCADCNLGKGAWDESDWRKKELKSVPET